MTEPVLVREQRGAVLVLRLNRPEARNALSFELISELGLGLEAAETDPGTRCAVLTGTGTGRSARGWTCGPSPPASP
jgi:enoyl-CoA hydratase/carnithine racemase